jgi:hypothetical protein
VEHRSQYPLSVWLSGAPYRSQAPFCHRLSSTPFLRFFSTNFTDIPLRMDPTLQSQVQCEFGGLRSEIAILRVALAKTQASRPRLKLPDPEKFAGSTYKFDTWLPLIKAKLAINSTAIRDATA